MNDPEEAVVGFNIPFTQFRAPHGERFATSLPVDEVTYAKAMEVLAAGLVFEVEILMNGLVSATISHPEAGDLDHCITANAPGITEQIAAMIRGFDITEGLEQAAYILTEG